MGDRGPNCEPIVPPTPKAKQHRTYLMICGFVHLALSICLCFIAVMSGIYEMIDVAILFCALAQCNFCCLIIYIVNISINFFTYFSILGLWAQTQTWTLESATTSQAYVQTIIIMLTVYYLVAIFVCFFAYREFKGMLFDAGMGQGFGMNNMVGGGQQVQGGQPAAA